MLLLGTGTGLLHASPSVWDIPVPELKKLAEKGEKDAELALARAYAQGKGVEANPQQALVWYQKAAEHGSGAAMRSIGQFYENGKGVERSIDEAVRWYKKAVAIREQTFAESDLLRLSKAGLTKEKLAGLVVEGGLLLSELDTTTPLDQLVGDLARHTRLRETGKGYWIGYNEHMFSIANRGDAAIPLLVRFAREHPEREARHAAALTLNLIGTESAVTGRFSETFTNRKAREALWELLSVEGLTDDVAMLLKRDPWPADLPAYFRAFQAVQDDCPVALNALDRYPIPHRPVDDLEEFGQEQSTIKFLVPKEYTISQYARLALEAIGRKFPGKVVVEERLYKDLETGDTSRYENPTQTPVTIKLEALLVDRLKDLSPVFDYCASGHALYYYGENQPGAALYSAKLFFCSAHTAKQRWLEWWKQTGEKRHSDHPPE